MATQRPVFISLVPFIRYVLLARFDIRLVVFCAVIGLLPFFTLGTVIGQAKVPSIPEILKWKDERDKASLAAGLGRNPLTDEAIYYALGSVQPDSMSSLFMKGARAPQKKVRLAALFALSQSTPLPDEVDTLCKQLFDMAKREKDPALTGALLETIAQIGGAAQAQDLATLPITPNNKALLQSQSKALARFAVRGIASDLTVITLGRNFRLAPAADSTQLDWAIYGLSRIPNSTWLIKVDTALFLAAQSKNASARMNALRALAQLPNQNALNRIFLSTTDPDWRVQVAAISSLKGYLRNIDSAGQEVLGKRLAKLLSSESYHVKKSILESVIAAKLKSAIFYDSVQSLYNSGSEDLRVTAIRTMASLNPNSTLDYIRMKMNEKKPSVGAFLALEILIQDEATVSSEMIMWAQRNVSSPNQEIALSALRVMASAWISNLSRPGRYAPMTSDLFQHYFLEWMDQFSTATPKRTGELQVIFSVLANPAMKNWKYADPVIRAMTRLSSSEDAETILEALKTIELNGRADNLTALTPLTNDPNFQVRKKAQQVYAALSGETVMKDDGRNPIPSQVLTAKELALDPIVEFKTTKGLITTRLLTSVAPYTVKAILKLIDDGFYNGLKFHRVVSNFVAQGGDPKGDGTGGPPFTMRSEFSTLSFERGMLGMASSGKDTEGSQFFFMHSHQPHLDGKYTIFGRVTKGQEIVDKLEQGDKILSVKVIKR